MGHHHHHHTTSTGWVLYASLIGTLGFTALEVVAGFQAHSLALLSDAGHNFTDAIALLLAAIGFAWQDRPANHRKTYGYQRAGVITAFINAITLIVVSGFILFEAVSRLIHPAELNDRTMMWVAAVGLALNGVIVIALTRGNKGDLNIRAAVVHMAGDAVGAVAIILGAVAIHFTGWLFIDPILSILLALFIVYTAWDITRESLNILLEGLPRGIELGNVTTAMVAVDGVLDVHDLHIWSLGSSTHALSSHVLIEDMPPSSSNGILKRLREVLAGFGIHHATIQFEHVPCLLRENGCSLTPEDRHAVCDHDHHH